MSIAVVVLVLAALLVAVSFAEPVATRLRLPASVFLAVFGVVIGTVALALRNGAAGEGVAHLAETITDLPLSSDAFLFVLLPVLLFQSAMNTDARHLVEDASSVFILAIVAVLVSTFVIGFALAPFTGVPLIACLLLAAIVATTDPIAVIGIFREAGAPARLVRLVEGESLLNDAAAITLFSLFLDLLVTGEAFNPTRTAVQGIVMPLGGVALGIALGRCAASLIGALREDPLAPTSISLALPYIAFALGEHTLHVSGVVAVVFAGITLGAVGPGKAPPDGWRHLRAVWEQLDWWAASLIFVLASILAPKLLADASASDFLLLAIVVVASLVARAAIIFGLIPLLARLKLSPALSRPFQCVVFWGGLRGATTLVLALAVTEKDTLPPEIRNFVAVLATGYVLFTLLVQGVTLRPLVRAMGVDRLSPVDLALRHDVFVAARRRVADKARRAAAAHGFGATLAPAAESMEEPAPPAADRSDRLAVALVTLARAERELIMERVRERSLSLRLVNRQLGDTRRLSDRARVAGLEGYREAASAAIEISLSERMAQWAARRFGFSGWLAHALADRFETLLIASVSLRGLDPFIDETIEPVLGAEIAAATSEALAERRAAVERALAALRLQYPEYAEALERRLLGAAALQFEEAEYDRLREDGLIGPELHRDLLIDISRRRRLAHSRPALDLGLDAEALIAKLPLFVELSDAAVKRLASLAEPVFARPGERLIRRGEAGDAAYFVSSGAVEVLAANGATIRLGRGEIFGEIALLTDQPRTADVDSIAYCSLIRLRRRAFLSFLAQNPEIAARIEAKAAERLQESPVEA
ncbi:cation:proton antiporter [Hansschlegelia sp.]|uniref:cation:proton antiporter n=1 Tax=Hansschlegelia sp. TaxID=2041892 RepID=UPI002C5523C8|nr:cation:proton antiporter [Hansschlegelia sp.]HVI27903.1 cation:proton antiporter [Hansschlegelia sp.]